MAKIEDFITQIPDERLRKAIAAEVRELKRTKKFGLVFEDHLPETVRLPNLPIKKGDLVAKKQESGNKLWRVRKIQSGKAVLDTSHDAYPPDTKDEIEFPLSDLVMVKRFGEAIYPTLTPVDRVARGGVDKPWHMLINADNFHALQLLLYSYEGRVDVIYIDPPYNTGAKDWKYNNDYVDENDSFRHSKWLSMIKKRLLLARRLLKPDGVMIVTIDEHEVQHLGILLRQLFTDSRTQMVTIVTNTAGSTSPGLFSRAEEYAYFSFFGKSAPSPMSSDLLAFTKSKSQYWFPLFRSRGLNDLPSKRPNLVYPIAVDPKTHRIVGYGRSMEERIAAKEIAGDVDQWSPDPSETLNGIPVVWPLLDTGEMTTWQLKGLTLLKLVKEGFVRVRKPSDTSGTRAWTLSYVKSGNRKLVQNGTIETTGKEPCGALILGQTETKTIPKTTWKVPSHDARSYGTTMLRNILGTTSFTYPKSPYAVRDTIQTIIDSKKNGVVLDFFAGSGTTFQAVAMLNAADNGSRRAILVTNNEVDEERATSLNESGIFQGDTEFEKYGVAEAVTWPRCKYLVNGFRADKTPLTGEDLDGNILAEGLNENIEYFRLNFLDADDVARGEAFKSILPILWMMAGCKGEREDSKGSNTWFIPKQSPFAVLIKEKGFPDFRKKLAERPDIEWVFLVTDSDENYSMMCRTLGTKYEYRQIYKSYLENFRINMAQHLVS